MDEQTRDGRRPSGHRHEVHGATGPGADRIDQGAEGRRPSAESAGHAESSPADAIPGKGGVATRHHAAPSLNRLAASATTHCMTGCAVGEVLGLAISNALGWSAAASIALAVALAFVFGYAFTMRPLVRSGMTLLAATGAAIAADTASIAVMEIVDNGIMLAIPGAMQAGLGSLRFWASLAFSLAVAWLAAFPVNRWLLARGLGHGGHGSH